MAGALGLFIALGLWGLSLLQTAHPGHMGDLGLLSVLPATFWAALAVLLFSFCWSVRRRGCNQLLLAAHIVLLIAILHATPAILYGTVRYSWSFKHIGIADYIAHHGRINLTESSLTVYQDWPGFFALNAFVSSAAGVHSALSYAAWAPAFNELLYLGPLLLIFRSFTADRRIVWTAVLIFYLGNWVGQDYFSPQAFAFFLYLVVIALCLRQLRAERNPLFTHRADKYEAAHGAPRTAVADRHDAWLAYALVVVISIVIASSHQLTPVMLVAALALLAIGGRLRYRSLPITVVAVSLAWVVVGAHPYLKNNVHTIFSGIGHPFGNTTATLLNLSAVSHDQVIIADLDRLLTVGVMALGAFGWWRNRQIGRGHAWFPAVLLVFAPISAVLGNSYGGEIGFRVYVFALPFLALFGACTFMPVGRRRRVGLPNAARLGMAAMLLGLFVFAYYGKESANYFPPQEVRALDHLYATAPPGTLLVSPTSNIPWGFTNYDRFTYNWITNDGTGYVKQVLRHPVGTLSGLLATRRSSYLVFDTAQNNGVTQDGSLPYSQLVHAESEVLHSPRFRVVAETPSVTILTLGQPGTTLLRAGAGAGAGGGAGAGAGPGHRAPVVDPARTASVATPRRPSVTSVKGPFWYPPPTLVEVGHAVR